MATATENAVQEIPIRDLRESPTNPRKHYDKAGLESLAESIVAHGVLQPITVRRIAPSGWEVVVGARRVRASKLAKRETVPALVRDLEDAQVREIQIVENLEREDVPPLDAADGIKELIEGGMSPEMIAGRLSRDVSWVHRMVKLAYLVPEGRALVLAGKISVQGGIAIGRLPKERQAALVAEIESAHYPWSEDLIRSWASRHALVVLGNAPWDLKDRELVPAAGACSACPKRTGATPSLFPEIGAKEDGCTDAICFDAKLAAFLGRIQADVDGRQSGPRVVAITEDWSRVGGDKDPLDALHPRVWREVKSRCPDSAIGFVVDHGRDLGKRRTVCLKLKGCAVHDPKPKPGSGAAAASRERIQADRLETEVRKRATAAVAAEIREPRQILPLGVLAAVAEEFYHALWFEHRKAVAAILGIEDPTKVVFRRLSQIEVARALLIMAAVPSIRRTPGHADTLGALAAMFSVKLATIRKAMKAAKKTQARGARKRRGAK